MDGYPASLPVGFHCLHYTNECGEMSSPDVGIYVEIAMLKTASPDPNRLGELPVRQGARLARRDFLMHIHSYRSIKPEPGKCIIGTQIL